MSRETSTPEDRKNFRELWEEFLLGNKSVPDVLNHSEFQQRGRMICYGFAFGVFNGSYGPEDLYQDTYFKILKSENKLRADNIPDAEAFFSWFHITALHTLLNV